MIEPQYIGDGVYVSFDGYQLWLETEREYGRKERIALEYATFLALLTYARRVWATETE